MSKKGAGKQQNKQSSAKKTKNRSAGKSSSSADVSELTRPPIVCFLGHVDHGKTTLLDYIRKTEVQKKETGGITQAIGAYHVDGITFIDTPGHEAFTAMRARGGQTADIAVLVVAADDGVQPQTVEAINHIKAAGAPMLVAINKMDLDTANPDKVKQQLSKNDVLVEDWGGQVVSIECSGATGQGVDELLEMLKLMAQMQELKADPDAAVEGILIESTLDPRRGPLATVIVRQGTLRTRDFLVAGQVYGRIKRICDWQGKSIKEVKPGEPAEILGLDRTAPAGTKISVVKDEKEAQELVLQENQPVAEQSSQAESSEDTKQLNLIIKANTQGSLDAILHSVEGLGTDEVTINVLHAGLGNISEADTLLAQSGRAITLGFQIKSGSAARQVVEQENLIVRTHKLIYHLLEDIEKLIAGKAKEGELVRRGLAEVLKIFTLSDGTKVAGCRVKEGEIDVRHQIQVRRGEELIGSGRILSLRQEKEKTTRVKEGQECGLVIASEIEFQEGDLIESVEEAKIESLL